MIANTPGSIIGKNGKSQVQRGDGSTEVFLDNAYELGFGFTFIGTFFDLKAAISGEDMSGEHLSWGWRLGGVLPFISEGKKIVSLVKSDRKLLKLAEETFSGNQTLRNEANNLIEQLQKGNMNPGIGTKHIENGIYEARSRGGARVYFRNGVNGGVEIVGYSNKSNQQAVIDRMLEVYKNVGK